MEVAIETKPLAVVLGAGVNGMTCAIRLLEQGWDVTLISKERPEATVSFGAGAIWEYPPYKIEPQDKAKRWALQSLEAFERLAFQQSATGVYMRRTHYLYRESSTAPSEAKSTVGPSVRDFREGIPAEADAAAIATGFSYLTPVVAMDIYLKFLERLIQAMGGRFVWREVGSLSEAAALASTGSAALPPALSASAGAARRRVRLMVNCAALGAGALIGDSAVYGVRGCLVLVKCPDILHVYSDESFSGPNGELTYIVPKGRGVVACAGCADPASAQRSVSAEEAAAVQARCGALVPALREAPVVGTWAGIRPCRRGGVRLEMEPIEQVGCRVEQGVAGAAALAHAARPSGPPSAVRDSFPVVHNYGHGGSGVVCSWGCAEDVARLAAAAAAAAGLPLRRRPLPEEAAAGLPPLPADACAAPPPAGTVGALRSKL